MKRSFIVPRSLFIVAFALLPTSYFLLPPPARAATHITGTYDLGANPRVMTTVGGTPEYGLVFAQRNKAVTYGGVEYGPSVVKGYLNASGQLNDGGGNLWLDLIPNLAATPADSYYVVTINIQGRVHAEIWIVPDVATVAVETVRQLQPPGGTGSPFDLANATGLLALAHGGTNQSSWTAARCVRVNNAGTQLEPAAGDCGTGGGSAPIASATVSGTVKTDTTTADPVVYLKTSADTLLAGKASSVHTHSQNDVTNLTTDLAGKESLANKNQANGYAGLSASSKLAVSQVQEVLAAADLTDYAGTSGSGATAIKATVTTPSDGQCLTWNNATTNWVNGACSGGSSNHNLLSATHPDTVAASPVLGDLVYGNSTPAWTKLAGNTTTTKKYLSQTGSGSASAAPAWAQVDWADLSGKPSTFTPAAHNLLSASHGDSTAASVVRGDLMVGIGVSPTWQRYAKGTQYQVLTGGASEPTWGAVALAQSTAVSGILGSANGGTGNDFAKFTGPTTAEKTFTLPDANATIEVQANKNAASGYAGLDSSSRIAKAQAPSTTVYADPAVSQTIQPTADASFIVKQYNGTNSADIFQVLDKDANKKFAVDASGNLISGALTNPGVLTLGATTSTTPSHIDLFGGDAASNSEAPYFKFTPSPAASGSPTYLYPSSTAGRLALGTAAPSSDPAATALIVTAASTDTLSNKTITAPVYTSYTVATLPSGATYKEVWVSDGNSATDCTVGGGSTKVKCYYNGSAWTVMSGGGSGGGADTALSNLASVAINEHLLFGADNTKDIGATGATRPRTGYFGTSVVVQGSGAGIVAATAGMDPACTTGDYKIWPQSSGTIWKKCTNGSITDLDTTGGGTSHAILSATHTDTDAATVVLGDILAGNATPHWQHVAGNTTTTKKYLSQTGNASISALPTWAQIAVADLSDTKTGSGNLVLATSPAFTTDIHAASAAGTALGTAALPFSNLIIGNAASQATTFNVTALTANRTVYVPNADSTLVVADAGASNNFLTAISATGAISKAQPTLTNLAGGTAGANSYDFTDASVTRPVRRLAFSSFPGTCTALTDFLARSDPATARQALYMCNSAGTGWDLVGDGGSGGGANAALSNLASVAINDHLLFGADNTKDIGATGATRPRTGYFGTSVVVQGSGAGVVSFTSGTNPSCSSEYKIWANTSDGKLKKCEGSTITDLDTTGGNSAFSAITTGTNTGATMTIGSGATLNGAAGGSVDLTSLTAASGFKVPSVAAATPSATGVIAYDSTNNIYRGYNGTAAKTFGYADTPGTTGTAPSWSSGGVLQIPMAATATVTAGLLSKTDYDTFNGKPNLVASGTAGLGPSKVGTSTTAARSDHDHKSIAQLVWFFPGTPATGVQTLTLTFPETAVNFAINDFRVTVGTMSASNSTFNIQRCTANCGSGTVTFSDIYSAVLTLTANNRTALKGSAPNQNVTSLTNGDQFRASLVTIGASLADVTVTMSYEYDTTN